MLRFVISFCLIFSISAVGGLIYSLDYHLGDWAVDPATGCKVWDNHPTSTTRVSWSGGCKDGKAQGNGKLIFEYEENGEVFWDVYDGTLVEGIQHGYGQLQYPNGSFYAGEFSNGEKTGRAVLTEFYDDGGILKLEGVFEEGELHGEGTYEFRFPGDVAMIRVNGTFEHNKPVGEVSTKMITKSGWVYEMYGPVKLKPFEFKGKIVASTEDGGEGEFEGRMTKAGFYGFGRFKRPKGVEYEGEIAGRKLNGKGWAKWPSGNSYEGRWKNDLFHGEGTYTVQGNKCKGIWLDGILVGFGDALSKDGKIMRCVKEGKRVKFLE